MRDKLSRLKITITELAEYLNCSRPTVYKYIDAYMEKDFSKLEDKVLDFFNFVMSNKVTTKVDVMSKVVVFNKDKIDVENNVNSIDEITVQLFKSQLDSIGMYKNSIEILKATLESFTDSIVFALDTNYRYYFFNGYHKEVMKNVYGSLPKISDNIFDHITIERDCISAKIRYDKALQGNSHSSIDYTQSKNGTKIYFESFYHSLRNDKKDIIGIAVYSRDITKRMVFEEEKNILLKEKENHVLEVVERMRIVDEVLNKKDNDYHSIYEHYIQTMIKLSDSKAGYIYDYNSHNNQISLMYYKSNDLMKPIKTCHLSDTGIIAKTIDNGEPFVLNRTEKQFGETTCVEFDSCLIIPVKEEDATVAVLLLVNKETNYDKLDIYYNDILLKNLWSIIRVLKLNEELRINDILLKASMDSQGTVILIDTNYQYMFYNSEHQKTMKSLYGIDIEIGHSVLENIQIKQDRLKEKHRYDRAFKGETFTAIDCYGEANDQYFETKYAPLIVDRKIIGASIYTTNVTEKMKELERVKESEEKFRMIYSTMSQGLAIHEIITDENDKPIDYCCLEVNDSYLKLFDYKREDIIAKRVKEFAPLLEDYWVETFGKVALSGEPKYYENYSRSVDKYMSVYAYSPKYRQFAVLISDITDRVKHEREIKYLSYNDQLTGLYNRRYYDEMVLELDTREHYPLSIIIGDVNGLKLVNDSFGHQAGDKLLMNVAEIFRKSCRSSDIITRIGGDEFVILLPQTSKDQATKVLDRIIKYSEKNKMDNITISVSYGLDTKIDETVSFEELFKSAEDEMYRNKVIESRSMRSKTVDLIMATLFEKNEREMLHSKRVSKYCVALGTALSLDYKSINLLKSAGLMHDIGKIGINDAILNKHGALTKEEYEIIQKHSEIGYRILNSLPEFADISTYILEHHERFDGTGYPNGLKGEDISLEGRIISIADAYDAMTETRPYKPTISKVDAINELRLCSGTQFDPSVIEVFINEVLMKEE